MTVVNCLIIIDNNTITYDNDFPLKQCTLISKMQIKYAEDLIVARDTPDLEISSKEVLQVVPEREQVCKAPHNIFTRFVH